MCGTSPVFLSGYPILAPKKAESDEGFKAGYFEDLFRLEESNFWFRSRNKLIIWALNRYFPHARTLLEIGCGTGYVLSSIGKERPDLKLFGSEIYSAGLQYAGTRTIGAELMQMDARSIPFVNEFDVIGAFDVLEHIEEDEIAVRQIYKALKCDGGVIITVPQHAFLWSSLDEYACHVRRYRAPDLRKMLERTGFTIVKVTSFITTLLPLMVASRLVRRRQKQFDPLAELNLPAPVNYVFEKCLDAERSMLRAGLTLPLGGSLLLVAKKYN